MELTDYRAQLDAVDAQLVQLFQQRMELSAQIGRCKKESGLPILQPAREREKLHAVTQAGREELRAYLRVLYSLLFELSRTYQEKGSRSALYERIEHAIEHTPRLFPPAASVACQGAEGSYSLLACERLFAEPTVQYFRNFEGVFSAVSSGFCRYGIVPVENSTAGSVKRVYDLMVEHRFCIVRSVRLKIDHCLLTKPGCTQIREVLSHEQALEQCARFLKSLGSVKLTCCENTAVAAQMLAQCERSDLAVLSSRRCAELYGLELRQSGVQDEGNNHTRFLCISKQPEIYPGANRTSVMLVLPHKPGALYKVLARLYALGINLLKLESRPLPNRDFEFLFYLDLETSVYCEEFAQLMCELGGICEQFQYLGSYSEIV